MIFYSITFRLFRCIVAALAMVSLTPSFTRAEHNLLVVVPDNQQLNNERTSVAPLVVRQDFSKGFGASALFYSSIEKPCTVNSGKGDGGWQVPSKDGGCWIAHFPANGIDVREFGARGDGSAFDSAAIQYALNAAGLQGGGIVWVPPTGAAYVINKGLMIGSGVHLKGAGNLNWAGPINNIEADWTNKNTWFHCEDTTDPCISINGDGVS